MEKSDQMIKEIAENWESGLTCYWNKKTGELKAVFADDVWIDEDDSDGEDDTNDIQPNSEDYIQFNVMDSRESFDIMADFADTVEDKKVQRRLIQVLNEPKPFAKFKWELEKSEKHRQKWFDFKNNRYIDYVKLILKCERD